MFLRAHSDCRLENRMVVFARVMGKAGRAVSEHDRGQWYWCRVTMASMVGSSGILDILRVKSIGFLDSLKVECERKEGNKIPSKFSVSATRRMGLHCLRQGRLWLEKNYEWSLSGEFECLHWINQLFPSCQVIDAMYLRYS